jgi:signal transduction histidine kinase
MSGFGLFWALDAFAEAYVGWGVRADGIAVGANQALWFLDRAGAFLPIGIFLLGLLYPTGRFIEGRWRIASWVSIILAMSASTLFLVGEPYPLDHPEVLPPELDRDLTTIHGSFLRALSGTLNVLAAGAILVPAAVVVVRHHRARGLERDRMRWLLWAVLVVVLLSVVEQTVGTLGLGNAYFAVYVLLPAVAVTIGLVRPRLIVIDDLLGATLLNGVIAALIVAVDLAVLALMDAVLGDALDQRQTVVIVLLIAALLYGPLRSLLGRWVRRLVLGSRDDPYDVVSGLANRLERVEDPGEQLAAIADAVASAFGVKYVRVEVDRVRGGRLVATQGVEPDETRVLPITYRGDEVGRLVLPARGIRARLTRRDEGLLGDLVRQAATAVRSAQLADELQDSREQLVLAREEERRRIRRDLHDGLGPALSGVVFQLESARLLAPTDPDAVAQSLTVTREHVQEVVADVRRLVHDLRPPALDDLGLVGAIRQQAVDAELSVEVEAADVENLPAAVEVAAYRIVSEALTNVTRHAQAGRCTIRLTVEDGQLAVEVADDGVGIDPAAEVGVGLVSLRERAAELGGRSEVVCPLEGGTVVRAWLPMRRGA